MADKIQIKRDSETGLYIATYVDRTLWIHHNQALGEWKILKPYAFKKPDGTYMSQHLGSYGRLYKAKDAVIRILNKKQEAL